jgi:hypothetical protein
MNKGLSGTLHVGVDVLMNAMIKQPSFAFGAAS